ncbi:MAG: carbonic anhydrase [Pyrinomonadaceae bacterium MAG19_C2-C3]|nr:carbonic anhydrase [Pyrinomonadaceae bacterium MAG19_C2-C3]
MDDNQTIHQNPVLNQKDNDFKDDFRIAERVKHGATMADMAREIEPLAQTPLEALDLLKNGNARFYSNRSTRPMLSAVERRAQVVAQTPFATILGCADSRVPTETIFDCGSGELFIIRVAGNAISGNVLASIEYAIQHLKSHLVVIMGHEGCGAVKAAMMPEEERNKEPENVQRLLNKIVPAVCNIPPIRDYKARMREAVIANVREQVHALKQNEVTMAAVAREQIMVVGAYYEISSGAVDFLETEEELRVN